MGTNIEKKIKALISGLIVNDDARIEKLVNELSESILPDKEEKIMSILLENFKGEKSNV
jgi:hypothetical protein